MRSKFSREFKGDIVEIMVSGSASAVEIAQEYYISLILISR